jgi:formylglycine-generating enzyme required for sulfatase activity
MRALLTWLLYELVTGRRPFVADTPMAVVLKHVTDPLPSPKKFVPDLPDQVEWVLAKALAKQPEDRYPDMEAFIAALEGLNARASELVKSPASPFRTEESSPAQGIPVAHARRSEALPSPQDAHKMEIGDTTLVGAFPSGASPTGVLDMAGNVWEWVADWYAEDYYAVSPYKNPAGPASGVHRVLRGGAFYNMLGEKYPRIIRVTFRGWLGDDFLLGSYGFRCALSP